MSSSNLLRAFELQVEWCRKLDANFTGDVVDTLAGQLRSNGPLAELLPDWPGDPIADAVPLRLCGALRALALAGNLPLAGLYPPAARTLDREALVRELNVALGTSRLFLERMLEQPPQTNEIGRSAVLLGGFAEIAQSTRLPLALLEIGASAGLNLHWDRYRFDLGDVAWGDPQSPVRIRSQWRGVLPQLPKTIRVTSRAGCDKAPLDPRLEADRRNLLAYVWPEQLERVARLSAALDLAQANAFAIDRADAAEWVDRHLARRSAGETTVVYHSIVWQYLAEATQQAVRTAISNAGRSATDDAPLAWLAFELGAEGQPPTLTLTQWPGGARRMLAKAHPHGAWVEWFPQTLESSAAGEIQSRTARTVGRRKLP
ncbi:MAG: DUF2332 family protein [Caldimonas sp.]